MSGPSDINSSSNVIWLAQTSMLQHRRHWSVTYWIAGDRSRLVWLARGFLIYYESLQEIQRIQLFNFYVIRYFLR